MQNKPIIIMAAMKVEFDFLLKKLENINCESIGKYQFYKGTIEKYPVIICNCHIMTINAAVATFIAIEKYKPIAILSQGTAGAHSPNIHTGDIVIGEKCANIISYTTPKKNKGEGSNSLEWKLTSFTSGENDKFEYQYADKHMIEIAKKISDSETGVHFGIIGSGDVWNKEIDKIAWLNEKYDTICEDMESIAIYTVANDFKIPVLGIRIISNNEIIGEPYDEHTCLKLQKFSYKFIQELIESMR